MSHVACQKDLQLGRSQKDSCFASCTSAKKCQTHMAATAATTRQLISVGLRSHGRTRAHHQDPPSAPLDARPWRAHEADHQEQAIESRRAHIPLARLLPWDPPSFILAMEGKSQMQQKAQPTILWTRTLGRTALPTRAYSQAPQTLFLRTSKYVLSFG